MPAFEAVLDDRETLNVPAFIKARWPPIGLRVAQAMLNPGHAGVPQQTSGEEWSFPPAAARGQRIAVATGAAVPATDQK
jgi:hypothetical protein